MKTKKLRWNMFWIVCLLLLPQAPVFAVEKPNLAPQLSEITKTTLYEFSVTLQKPLLPTAALVFVFPEEFNLTYLRMAGSSQVNGGFDVMVSGRTVQIKRSGLGAEIPANTALTFLFGNIKNPSKPGVFRIESWIEENPHGRSVPVFHDVSITEN